ncbi:hypothetical protein Pint_16461 [Pistacia integerrima]|uniref:Uncharacterized protein n=1 Tax=Pistacia integerrima TaxID=434235 RepID=A0ACC0ZBN5_9ROSI|nr:hypothetical protein Pint_16461 [Pistacia integerrima]
MSKELERAEKIAATEEEVEEFFAILKRMQAAVKYFGEGWRTAVESEVAPDAAAEVVENDNINGGDDEGNDKEEMVTRKKGERVVVVEEDQNGFLDLNSVPGGESHFASD